MKLGMDKEEMHRLMGQDIGDRDAWVHNPLSMEPENAAVWCALSLEAISNLAGHMAEHLDEEQYSVDEDGEEVPNWFMAAAEMQDLMLMAHNVVEVISRKLLKMEEIRELTRAQLERQTGHPIRDVIATPLGFLAIIEEEGVPDDLSGMEGGGMEGGEGE